MTKLASCIDSYATHILAADGVHGGVEFAATFAFSCVLDVQEDDEDNGIIIYRDAICVEASRFGSESLNICDNLLLEVAFCAKDVL